MKIQASVLEFSIFLIFSTFHAIRAINLKTPSKNLSDASSHFGLLIGNTFTNDSLGNAGHVIIPVFYHTETSLPPTSKSTRTVTKTTLTTEKLTSRNPTSSNTEQQGQSKTSHGPIITNSNSSLNNSDKNNSNVGSVTDNFSNLNAKSTGSSRKTTVKQETNPPSYSKAVIQMTTALLETNKATIYIDVKKTEQNGELTTGTSTLKPKSTTPKHTTPTLTTQTTTQRTTQVASQSTTTLKTTKIPTSTTKIPTSLPTTKTQPTQKSTKTSTTTPAPTTPQTTTATPAPTTPQTTKTTTTTPAPTTPQTTKTTTTTPAPTTPQTTKTSTTTSRTTKLQTTALQTTTSTTTKSAHQVSTTNIGSNDSAKKHNESLVSTTVRTATQTIPSMSQTSFNKISTFPTNSTEAGRPTTTAETLSEEPSQSDGDKYWPVAMAITIGVPSIIVIGVTISVINRKRTLEKAHSTLLNGYITPPVEYEV